METQTTANLRDFIFNFFLVGEHALRPLTGPKFISSLHACKISRPCRSPFFYTCRVDSSVVTTCNDLQSAVAHRPTHQLDSSFLLTLATQHPQSGSMTEVEGSCTSSQVSPTSATCCKKFNSVNILHCPSGIGAEPVPGYTCNILVSQQLQHQKEVLCCQCE